ncbi:MAG: PqqD family protein [Acidimicrobiales bacterium]
MKRTSQALSKAVGDETIVLHVESGHYYGLNEVGAFIWSLLDDDIEFDQILCAVRAEFDIDKPSAELDIQNLLDELHAKQLIDY